MLQTADCVFPKCRPTYRLQSYTLMYAHVGLYTCIAEELTFMLQNKITVLTFNEDENGSSVGVTQAGVQKLPQTASSVALSAHLLVPAVNHPTQCRRHYQRSRLTTWTDDSCDLHLIFPEALTNTITNQSRTQFQDKIREFYIIIRKKLVNGYY